MSRQKWTSVPKKRPLQMTKTVNWSLPEIRVNTLGILPLDAQWISGEGCQTHGQ